MIERRDTTTINTATEYNKLSYRACGFPLVVIKICRHCNQPTVWNCPRCLATYDSKNVHCVGIAAGKRGEFGDKVEIKTC